jgi:hypothetical protein
MSYVVVAPEMVAEAAGNLARIGSAINGANAAAAASTLQLLPAAADEVSAAISALFSGHAQEYQALSAQTAAFHDQLRYTKTTGVWSLYWRDRNLGFHAYDLVSPTASIEELLAEVDRDPTAIFWG